MRTEAEKAREKINKDLLKALRGNRLATDLTRKKIQQLRRNRLDLIELATKTMTHEEIGAALGLTKQRISAILAARQRRNGDT